MTERLDKIRSTGYWRVNIRPRTFREDRLPTLAVLRETVEHCKVGLRGWDFPHLDPRETCNIENWLESGADFGHHVECWKFYQSGQFIHYCAMKEDYVIAEIEDRLGSLEPSPSHLYLSILSTLYRVTEIFEFIARLTTKGLYLETVHVFIGLFGTQSRQLFFWDQRYLSMQYICQSPKLEYQGTFETEQVLSKAAEFAMNVTVWIFERFQWTNVPREVLLEDQKKLIEGRF